MRTTDLALQILDASREVRGNVSITIIEYFRRLFKIAELQHIHADFKIYKEIIFAVKKSNQYSLSNVAYIMIKIDKEKPVIVRLDYNDSIHLWEVDKGFKTNLDPIKQWGGIKKYYNKDYRILVLEE